MAVVAVGDTCGHDVRCDLARIQVFHGASNDIPDRGCFQVLKGGKPVRVTACDRRARADGESATTQLRGRLPLPTTRALDVLGTPKGAQGEREPGPPMPTPSERAEY